MTKPLYAGMETEAPCGRCKTETVHRVLSITDGVPEKLICAICSSIHKFRPERAPAERKPKDRAAQSAKAPRASASSPSSFHNLMIAERAGAIAKPYGQGVAWEKGMWLDHPAFGLGKVQHKAGKKIDVLFQAGLKTLVAL